MSRDDRNISDELLNAFLDGQLDAAERGLVLNTIQGDKGLAQRACELRHIKELTQYAYHTQLPTPPAKQRKGGNRTAFKTLAASILLTVGMLLGWVAHDRIRPPQYVTGMLGVGISAEGKLASQTAQEKRIVLHLSSGEPGKVEAALNEAEDLIQSYRKSGQPLKIDFIANGGGLNLLRADVSTQVQRVLELMRRYPNITFLACHKTIEHLQEKGIKVRLLPHTEITPSALQLIIRRLQEGWVYIKA